MREKIDLTVKHFSRLGGGEKLDFILNRISFLVLAPGVLLHELTHYIIHLANGEDPRLGLFNRERGIVLWPHVLIREPKLNLVGRLGSIMPTLVGFSIWLAVSFIDTSEFFDAYPVIGTYFAMNLFGYMFPSDADIRAALYVMWLPQDWSRRSAGI